MNLYRDVTGYIDLVPIFKYNEHIPSIVLFACLLARESCLRNRIMEPVSFTVGIVGLAGLFSTCVDCFEYVQLGREFAKDYQTSELKLDILKTRMIRWGASVGVNDPAAATAETRFQVSTPTEEDLRLLANILGSIGDVFLEMEEKSKKFASRARPNDLDISAIKVDSNASKEALRVTLRKIANKRQKRSSLGQKTRWALYERKHFQRLLEDVSGFINDLEKLFPAQRLEVEKYRIQLCQEEVEQIDADQDDGELLNIAGEISANVIKDDGDGKTVLDSVLQEAVKAQLSLKRTGNRYGKITGTGNAQILAGDDVAAGEHVQSALGGHEYGDVTGSKNAVMMAGNKYGGKSFFEIAGQNRTTSRSADHGE